jgi:ankyrin repeat protein
MQVYELHRAVRDSDLSRIYKLLNGPSQRFDVNQVDRNNATPLMYAIQAPHVSIDVTRMLLQHGAKVDHAVVRAALYDLEKLKVLIDAGGDICYQTENGYDALINVAYSYDVRHNPQLIEILRFLIAKGVPLRGMTPWNESAVRVLSRIGRFDAVQFLLNAGANPEDVKLTPLIEAVAFATLSDVTSVLDRGVDLEETEYWERTAWLIAIQVGDVAKAQLLLERGANRNVKGRCGKLPLSYAIEDGHIPMLKWLLELGIDIEQTDDFGQTVLRTAVEACDEECLEIILKAGANVHAESRTGTALGYASTSGIAIKLLQAGADPQHLSRESRRSLLGYPPEPNPELLDVTTTDFEIYRSRQFGVHNPQKMNNRFWEGMIRSGLDAYQAGQLFRIGERFGGDYAPIWCAQRYGQSLTLLADGRIIQIAGEHEDSYDPDFCIYNDVFVHTPNGDLSVYGYPENLFPPTDFHTATLVGEYIYLIGSLGYPTSRLHGETPVYRIDTRDLHIERIETTGTKPGWIYKHRAILLKANEIQVSGGKILSISDSVEIQTENHQKYILDVNTGIWFFRNSNKLVRASLI